MQLPNLSGRRLAGTAALACAAALIPVAALAAAASAAPAAAASAPRCSTAGLVVWVTHDPSAAGTFYYTLNFTNLSGHACTLRGHPGVSAVSLTGGRIGIPATWGDPGNARLRTVRLANGATATAALTIRDVGAYSPSTCHQVEAAGLRVYPPNQLVSKVIPYPFAACSTRQGFMDAGPVQKQK
jgi:hypothetical protein